MSVSEPTAEVAVPVPLIGTFHYRVPVEMAPQAKPGCRVLVPFAGRQLSGWIVRRDTPPPLERDLEPLLEVQEPEPTFDSELLSFLIWLAAYYRSPIGEVLRGALPPGTQPESAIRLTLTESGRQKEVKREVGRLLDALRPLGSALLSSLTPPFSAEVVGRAVREGWVERSHEALAPRVEVHTEKVFRAVAPAPILPRGKGGKPLRRDELLAWLNGRGAVPGKNIREVFSNATALLKDLIEEGSVAAEEVEVLRDPFFGEPVTRDRPPPLTPAQRAAVTAIGQPEGFAGFLLYGITGSGKTEVYLHAIEDALAKGKSALVMVPEIALTPQLVRRFRARLGDAIAVLHSGLSDGARFDQWRRLRRGEVRIALGARSSIFAPLPKLGLIIADEEHDPSYKQGDGVRYHARDMALVRGARAGAVVVLGSATPALESTHNVTTGKLKRLPLMERPTGGRLPSVELIDLRGAPKPTTEPALVSQPLRQALAETLARGEQAILFLNRRGFSSFSLCTQCGFVPECDQCSISFTWHRSQGRLRCHYCDASRPLPTRCPQCGHLGMELPGQGTERVEDGLSELFPGARVVRLDRDTASSSSKLECILSEMRARRIDILVGTQMVTKGHDFPDVTLVGVLAADAGLAFPDFRASERTFQLLAQVAGRAGRGQRPGRVLVQTYNPSHPCLQALIQHDYPRFSQHELALRQAQGYPPFTYAAALRFDGTDPAAVEVTAQATAAHLLQAGANRDGAVLRGPTLAPLTRIKGRTRYALLLTAPTRALLWQLLDKLPPPERGAKVRTTLDVDPYDFL